MPFTTPLKVELMKEDDGIHRALWCLTEPLRYTRGTEFLARTFVVPAGFLTDFASVPRVPIVWELDGDIAEDCATLHDWLYSTGLLSRSEADYTLRIAMQEQGFGWARRWSLWLGVRLFGAEFYHAAKAAAP